MVDMISLCQLYKQYKITNVKQIYEHHNPADFITKAKYLSALKTLININYINISTTKGVE